MRIDLVSDARLGIKISGEHPAKEEDPWCSANQNRFNPKESQYLANSLVSLIA